MKLITETVEDIRVITEAAADGKKNFYIEGVFMMGNIQNRNGRYYPVEILENAAGKYTESHINNKRAFGELGHPDGPSINLDRVSHLIESLVRDGNNFIGKALILPTPMGKIAAGILEAGGKLGVSTRGLGSLEETNKGYKLVKNDFFLSTAADIVADPSAPDAFVNGIMEGIDFCWENDLLVAKKARQQIEQAVTSRELNEEKMLDIFERFVRNISEGTQRFTVKERQRNGLVNFYVHDKNTGFAVKKTGEHATKKGSWEYGGDRPDPHHFEFRKDANAFKDDLNRMQAAKSKDLIGKK